MTATKPFLSYENQLKRMVERGLTYSDHGRALAALKGIGYYRLSAYTYPFRQEASPEELDRGRQRGPCFRPGSRLEDALALYEFDEKLRATLLRGLQTVEVGVAVKLGYTIGKRDPMGHLRPEHLDQQACAQVRPDGRTAFEHWQERYEKLLSDAKTEEYVHHHLLHYEGNVPVWAATGFLDFGGITRLYGLAQRRDQDLIARELGLSGSAGQVLHRWMLALNIVRNHCAHNNRVWNRSTVNVPPKTPVPVCPPALAHTNDLGTRERQKLYFTAALVAYLTRQIDATSTWAYSSFKTVAKKFPEGTGMTPINTLGFPESWLDLPLWQP